MTSELDLNIENYNLEELIGLFKININFDEKELKKAKKIVLKTHPDKSGLPKEYFLFYSKAYKYLYKIYDFRNKKEKFDENVDYKDTLNEAENKKLLTETFKNKGDFHNWFNDMFNNLYVKNDFENTGYGNWLSSNDNIINMENKNKQEQEEIIKTKKKEMQLIEKIDEPYIYTNCSNIISDTPISYSSGEMFGKFQYDDIKHAHSETIIPVDEEEILKSKPQFKNEFEFQLHRKNQKFNILSQKEGEHYFNNQNNIHSEIATKQAFQLLKQEEISKKNNNIFWSKVKLLNNK